MIFSLMQFSSCLSAGYDGATAGCEDTSKDGANRGASDRKEGDSQAFSWPCHGTSAAAKQCQHQFWLQHGKSATPKQCQHQLWNGSRTQDQLYKKGDCPMGCVLTDTSQKFFEIRLIVDIFMLSCPCKQMCALEGWILLEGILDILVSKIMLKIL